MSSWKPYVVFAFRSVGVTSVAVVWGCVIVLLAGDISYLLFALSPFYGNGIAFQVEELVRGGAFDPKGYAPFNWGGLGNVFRALSLLSIVYVDLVTPFVTLIASYALRYSWGRFVTRTKIIVLVIVAVSALLWLADLTIYQVIGVWLLD